jgi:transcriptional regulator GlxA family with amidase domain
MSKRVWTAYGLLGAVVVALVGFGLWVGTLPEDLTASPTPVPAAETTAMLEAFKPPMRQRPVIAVVGINDATETTDYLLPTGILRRADVADVHLVATGEGPVRLYPALTVEPDMTMAAFDSAYPDGPDYVIVPAMSRDDDPAVMDWLRQQAAKGSIVIGVCAGAKVVAAAGLLEGRRGTTHWFYLRELLQENPTVTYVADRRIVVDATVATTTGITASMPMALTLIEAIAGRHRAEAVATEIGLDTWGASHDSAAFRLTRPFATTVMGNVLRFWERDEIVLPLEPGLDTASLALAADAWSRTFRSRAVTSAGETRVIGSDGIVILPDRLASASVIAAIAPPGSMKPALALDQTLEAIAARYGGATAKVVAMQLEYPRSAP